MKLKLIACEVMFREICALAAESRNIVDLEFLPKGLHDIASEEMAGRLQACIDASEGNDYEAVLLAYALCNNGVVGLTPRSCPLVIPKAHDCITLLMGSRARYQQYFDQHPGTFFRSPGWMERDFANVEGSIYEQLGLTQEWREMVEKYGEDNAKYIVETMGGWKQHYTHLLYIDTRVAQHLGHEDAARQEAEENGWTFERTEGDVGLLRRLLEGEWRDDEFLVVEPSQQIVASNNVAVMCSAACSACGEATG